jgi:uncharacterized SAM-binding protein YcdF (DUF218 family)
MGMLQLSQFSQWIQKNRLRFLILGTFCFGLGIGIRQSLILVEAEKQPPSVIVVLGGGIRREQLAARLAQDHPQLRVIISSGSKVPCLYKVFTTDAGIPWEKVTVDLKATDTLTNFTATLPYLQQAKDRKVWLVATDGHLPRARLLAGIIWGSQGIAMEPVVLKGEGNEESIFKTGMDTTRALLWLGLREISTFPFYTSSAQITQEQQIRGAQCELLGFVYLPEAFSAF